MNNENDSQVSAESTIKQFLLIFPSEKQVNDLAKLDQALTKAFTIPNCFQNNGFENKTFNFTPISRDDNKSDIFRAYSAEISVFDNNQPVDVLFITFYITSLDNPFIFTLAPFCQTTVFFINRSIRPDGDDLIVINKLRSQLTNSILLFTLFEDKTEFPNQSAFFPINLSNANSIRFFVSYLLNVNYSPSQVNTTKFIIYTQKNNVTTIQTFEFIDLCLPSSENQNQSCVKVFPNDIRDDSNTSYSGELFLIKIRKV